MVRILLPYLISRLRWVCGRERLVDLLRGWCGFARLLCVYGVRLGLWVDLGRGWMLRPDHLFVGQVGVRLLHVLCPVYDVTSR